MRQLLFTCAGILSLILIASALYVKLPGYQAIGLTLFGACFLGLLGFGWYIKVEEGKRDHRH